MFLLHFLFILYFWVADFQQQSPKTTVRSNCALTDQQPTTLGDCGGGGAFSRPKKSGNTFIVTQTGFWTGRGAETFKPSTRSRNETRLAQGNWEREHKQGHWWLQHFRMHVGETSNQPSVLSILFPFDSEGKQWTLKALRIKRKLSSTSKCN